MSNLSKVILGTGNYYDVKSGNTVSVTGDGGNAWGYFGPAYKKLAPKLVTYTPYAEKYDFNLLLPEFRGANLVTNKDCVYACGSEYAKRDIKDAIDYVVDTERVDPENVFLLGASGGGHMALLMAGYCPEYFKAIGAYVPITDLKKWTEQNARYKKHVLACCSNSEDEMALRSPVTYIDTIAKATIKIFHGKYDTAVPVTQSMELYQQIFEKYPQSKVFLDIFDGGHQIDMEAAMYWIFSQYQDESRVDVTG